MNGHIGDSVHAHADQEHNPDPWPRTHHDLLMQCAGDLYQAYGDSAADDAVRVSEWLASRGLLSPAHSLDAPLDQRRVDATLAAVERLIREGR